MTSRSPTRAWRVALVALLTTLALAMLFRGTMGLAPRQALAADGTYQSLPFAQDWTNIALLATNDDWSGVPGVIGYRGDDLTTATGTDPQTIVADGAATPVDVNVNQTNPDTFTAGGVTEFHIANPVIALTGSGTADAPHIVLHLNTTGMSNITVAYNLRDLDGSTDNAVQAVALQYRVGGAGNYINIPAGFVADATTGPSQATLVTPVSALLPAAANNQAQVQIRIITTNAAGNDEWVGIDDISVTSGPPSGTPDLTVSKSGPTQATPNEVIAYTLQVGNQGSATAANVTVTDTLPAQVSYLSYSSSTPLTFTNNAPTLIWDAGNVMTGTSFVITVNVQVNPVFSQTITNTVQVATTTSGDNPANNQDSASTSPPAGGLCGQAYTAAYAIQGTGTASPLPNDTPVTVEGVVTGDFQGASGLNGFYLQDATGDGNPASSDGLFIFAPSAPDVSVGQRVRVSGEVLEFTSGNDTLTEINDVSSVLICGPATVPTPVVLDLPVPTMAEFERYENMLVTLPEVMTASEVFNIGRFGEVVVAADGRLYQPTNFNAPGAPSQAAQDLNNRRSFILDDGSNTQNPAVVPYLAADNTLRLGDTTTNLTGVMTFGFSRYRMQPTAPVSFTRVNNRTAAPAPVGGTVSVASYNVLNYFTTIDNGSNDARGADSPAEFVRQRTKLINALVGVDADIIGLIEMENNAAALQDLVAGLNISTTVPYTIAPGMPAVVGTDAIKVAIIYRPSVVTPLGTVAIDNDPIHDRPPVAQTFLKNGQIFTVVINHFKSKGSCPGTGTDLPNEDSGDGQGCWNAKRIQQAQSLLTFLGGIQSSTGDSDFVIMGDLNAYAMEDPIGVLEAAGYTRLSPLFLPIAEQYSYVFQGQAGELDHLMTSASLTGDVSGMTIWKINSDEPIDLDYNDDVLTSGESSAEYNQPYLYQPFGYRSSDHDPALAGLNLVLPVADFTQPDYQTPETSASATIAVTLTATADLTGTVQYQTMDGSATAGQDYTATAGTLTFVPGSTSASFTVPILDDALLEGNETVILELQPLDVGGTPSGSVVTATLTILDNEAPTAVTLTELGARSTMPLGSLFLAGLVLVAVGLLRLRRR